MKQKQFYLFISLLLLIFLYGCENSETASNKKPVSDTENQNHKVEEESKNEKASLHINSEQEFPAISSTFYQFSLYKGVSFVGDITGENGYKIHSISKDGKEVNSFLIPNNASNPNTYDGFQSNHTLDLFENHVYEKVETGQSQQIILHKISPTSLVSTEKIFDGIDATVLQTSEGNGVFQESARLFFPGSKLTSPISWLEEKAYTGSYYDLQRKIMISPYNDSITVSELGTERNIKKVVLETTDDIEYEHVFNSKGHLFQFKYNRVKNQVEVALLNSDLQPASNIVPILLDEWNLVGASADETDLDLWLDKQSDGWSNTSPGLKRIRMTVDSNFTPNYKKDVHVSDKATVPINGDETFKKEITKSLELLKKHAETEYNTVVQFVSEINKETEYLMSSSENNKLTIGINQEVLGYGPHWLAMYIASNAYQEKLSFETKLDLSSSEMEEKTAEYQLFIYKKIGGDRSYVKTLEKRLEELQNPKNDSSLNGEWAGNLGKLTVTNATENNFDFAINVENNGHMGDIDGKATVQDGKATFEDSEYACQIEFTLNNDSITVTESFECMNWHGMNVSFDGTYRKK